MADESFIKRLETVARDTMESRLQTWLNHHWDKEILPAIIREATARVRVECITNANIPEEIRVRLRFDPTTPLRKDVGP